MTAVNPQVPYLCGPETTRLVDAVADPGWCSAVNETLSAMARALRLRDLPDSEIAEIIRDVSLDPHLEGRG